MVVFMLSNATTPLYAVWQHELGFSAGALTLIFSAYVPGVLIALLIGGQAADRHGRKPVLLPGLLAGVIACLLFCTAHSLGALILARFFAGLATGVAAAVGVAAVVDLGGADRHRIASLLASLAMAIGVALGVSIVGVLARVLIHPAEVTFGAGVVIVGIAMLVVALLPLKHFANGQSGSSRQPFAFPRVSPRNRIHLILGISVFAPAMTAASFTLALGPSLLAELRHEISPLLAGAMACVMFLCGTLAQLALRRQSARTILLASAGSVLVGMTALAVATVLRSQALLIMGAVFAGTAQSLGQLGGLTLIGLHIGERERAQANALLAIGAYVPAGILPVADGFLVNQTGLVPGTFIFAIVLVIAALAGGGFVWTKLKRS